jgi:hypothetical protein
MQAVAPVSTVVVLGFFSQIDSLPVGAGAAPVQSGCLDYARQGGPRMARRSQKAKDCFVAGGKRARILRDGEMNGCFRSLVLAEE